ncbi:MAG: ABC transporter ATP-binding protein [Bacteroidales bacterium]|nr:ABC transporter ATP-binding protein [Bacteroidales bacterium]MBN2818034.1 ABC transporter ATP-binding protein [Bacteroidales bacterium]
MPILEITNLVKDYSTGSTMVHALRGISCSISEGTTASIVGKSGCGKSTLLNILGGLDQPTKGLVNYKGQAISSFKSNRLADYRKTEVGMIFQSFNLIPTLTAWENIAMALAIGDIPRKRRKQRATELLGYMGLEDRTSHLPTELSGGECQRVAIARSIANNPKVILADEPTGNLDTETSGQIMTLLRKLNKEEGKTIIMVTHDLEYANNFADLIITMKDGQIIETKEKLPKS